MNHSGTLQAWLSGTFLLGGRIYIYMSYTSALSSPLRSTPLKIHFFLSFFLSLLYFVTCTDIMQILSFAQEKKKKKKAFTMRTGGDTHRELGGTCCNSVKKDIWSLLSQHCDSSVFREGTSATQKQICLLEGWEEACHGCWGRG